jgi:8-oxo-dGTP diphosphatase
MSLTELSKVRINTGNQAVQHPHFARVDSLPTLAFDHADIVTYAAKRLRAKLEYTNAAYSLLPREFTLSELQEVYEAILGKRFDKRNFRKKYLELGLIKPTGRKTAGGRQRPAALYSFKSHHPAELKKFF